MDLPDTLLTVFSGEIKLRDGTPCVAIPPRELDIGELEIGEQYRVAVLALPEMQTESVREDAARSRQGSHEPAQSPVERGEIYEVEIESIGEQGDGVARVGPGYIVFVPNTSVGDRVTVEITSVRKNFAFAEVIEEEPVPG